MSDSAGAQRAMRNPSQILDGRRTSVQLAVIGSKETRLNMIQPAGKISKFQFYYNYFSPKTYYVYRM